MSSVKSAVKRIFSKFSATTGEQIHDERGHEIPDPTPVAAAIGHRPGPTLREQIRDMIQSEKLRMEAEAAGFESLEEADDFDVGDDYEPNSPYELDADLPQIAELKRRKEEAEKAEKPPAPPAPKPSKKVVAPDQGASGIGSLSDPIEAPEEP